jgi:hypothetical protein
VISVIREGPLKAAESASARRLLDAAPREN